MKIVIIGNGFDLANGLLTRYEDFYNYKVRLLEDKYKVIRDVLSNLVIKSKSRDKFTLYKSIRNTIYFGPTNNERSNSRHNLEESLNHDIELVLNTLKEIIENLIDDNLTFWDIYFWGKKELFGKHLEHRWCDIEDKIEKFISENHNNDELAFIFSLKSSHELIKTKIPFTDIDNNISDDYFENILYACDKFLRFKLVISIFMSIKKDEDIYLYLFNELRKFEKSFGMYISSVFSNAFKNDIYDTYISNFLKLIDYNNSTQPFIINFNYTSLKRARGVKKAYENNYEHESAKITCVFTEINIHGTYDKKCIFGIDQSDINSISDQYIFTKTYRKLKEQEDIVNIGLPKKCSDIIFYGHSLSKADYSYFQSIFDFYDIYHSNIKLIFIYSLYGEESQYESKKSEYLNAIIKLISDYGKTMDNKNHGKNLIHKLIIEDRLTIKEIPLQKISYS